MDLHKEIETINFGSDVEELGGHAGALITREGSLGADLAVPKP